jgi:hypothetical protein
LFNWSNKGVFLKLRVGIVVKMFCKDINKVHISCLLHKLLLLLLFCKHDLYDENMCRVQRQGRYLQGQGYRSDIKIFIFHVHCINTYWLLGKVLKLLITNNQHHGTLYRSNIQVTTWKVKFGHACIITASRDKVVIQTGFVPMKKNAYLNERVCQFISNAQTMNLYL